MIMDDKIIKLINKFEEDPNAVSKIFGGPENVIKYILSRGDEYKQYMDPKNEIYFNNEIQDLLIWEQYQAASDKHEYLKHFAKQFLDSDVDVIGDKIVWITDKEDLAEMFDDRGRNGTARDIAERILNDDDFDYYFDNVINDFYEECIETLDDNNKKKLANKIVSELPPLSKDDFENVDFLEELWEVKGQPETLVIGEDDIDSLLDDEEATKHIMFNFFRELMWDMENSYTNAYNSAYESELADDVYGGLKGMFGDSGQMVERGKNYKGNPVWKYNIDITNSLEGFFREYFSGWKYNYNQFEYFGSFHNLMKELFDNGHEQIDFGIPDYPDHSDVQSSYNEYVEI
jgi:hypothetical protein